MTDFLDIGVRNLLFWTGVGGLAVPILCHSLRSIVHRLRGGDSPRHPFPVADQLQGIEGVGPQIARVLVDAGLDSFGAISAATPSEIQHILESAGPSFRLANPATWPEQAKLLAAGDIEGFLNLAITLTAGVTILENIDGIGEATGERLRLAGINTVARLANASEAQVREALDDGGLSAGGAEISSWITQARRFDTGDSDALAELAGNLLRATMPAAVAANLAGRTDTATLIGNAGRDYGSAPWFRQNAAIFCTGALGVLLLIVSFLFPAPTPVERERRYDRECTLNGRTTFPESALFEKGRTTLTQEGVQVIAKFVIDRKREAAIRKDKPDKILVIGFASEEGAFDYNQWLSEQRAKVIADRLLSEMAWARTLFTYAGRGESEAKQCYLEREEKREACRVGDRKIEVLVAYGAIDPASAQRTCTAWREVVPPAASKP